VEEEAMSNRLNVMRACIALRIVMRYLERAHGPRVDQAVELVLLANELLIAEGDLCADEVEAAVTEAAKEVERDVDRPN
jgi:hypothetical protein